VLSVAIVAAFAGIAPFALEPLPRIDGFIPAAQSIIFLSDLATAVLLFAQAVIARSKTLLVLASGYLFSGLMAAAHTLTFPGAFSPNGLFGAGAETAAWLYVVWHVAFPAAALGYALLKAKERASGDGVRRSPATALGCAVGVTAAAVAITWVAILWSDWLPSLVVSERAFDPLASSVSVGPLVLSVAGLAVLATRRTSALDWWLIVALCASIAEASIVVFVGASRYTVAFYFGRVFALIVASSVLSGLLWELTRLYASLSLTVRALERERESKVLNLSVMIGALAHEIKQPLTAISICSSVARDLLRVPAPDMEEVRATLDDVERGSLQIGEVVDNIRALLKTSDLERASIDTNELVHTSLEVLRAELQQHEILVSTELAPDVPPIAGHRGQLREVVVNLVQNAMEAMNVITGRARTLCVRTERRDAKRVSISIEDTGCGIEPQRIAKLFDAFVTTKPQGTGLGLAICRMIVERHDGQLAVLSEVGKGTRFEVTLPAVPPPLATGSTATLRA
jgi:signal transduction histidine kinase